MSCALARCAWMTGPAMLSFAFSTSRSAAMFASVRAAAGGGVAAAAAFAAGSAAIAESALLSILAQAAIAAHTPITAKPRARCFDILIFLRALYRVVQLGLSG